MGNARHVPTVVESFAMAVRISKAKRSNRSQTRDEEPCDKFRVRKQKDYACSRKERLDFRGRPS